MAFYLAENAVIKGLQLYRFHFQLFSLGLLFPNIFTGPHADKTARIKIYPWPFISPGKPLNISVAFTPGKLILLNIDEAPQTFC